MAAVAAGLLASPWGAAVRADARVMLDDTSAGPATAPAPSSPAHRPAPQSTATRSPAATAQAAVDAAVPRLVAGLPAGSVSIVGIDATNGVQVAWGAHTVMPAASVFKLTLLECYLLSDQEQGQQPGAGAPDALTAMIDNSDNDSADQIYAALGGDDGVSARMARLGLSSTVLGPREQWGLSTTSGLDQARVLTDLVSPSSPLSAASRAYAIGLMNNVEADQRWGVGAAADPGSGFANKNGWLNVDDDGGRWVVSSVGLIEVGGHRVQVAVLTQHDADFASGISLVESLARTVADALHGQP